MKKILYLCLFFLLLFFKGSAQMLDDCSTCSTKIIKPEQIKNLSIDEIRLLINVIFARNGYQFENSKFQDYFRARSWYESKGDNKAVSMNETEKQNIQFLQETTKALKARNIELINQLKSFKKLVLTNKKNELKSQFGFFYENVTEKYESESLKEVLNKIDLDDINYYKNRGLNSVIQDNGFVKIVYKLSIEGESVEISYIYMAHSEIIEGFTVFTNYYSEDEYACHWEFEFTNGKLKFIRLLVAG